MGIRFVKLTGNPVSNRMNGILERLERKEDVAIDEINATPEIETARACVSMSVETVRLKNREPIQAAVFRDMMMKGSAVEDDSGNVSYTGDIARGRRLDIVIGLSASGKSSALVDVLSKEYASRVIDNDMVKERLPGYDGGWGAGAVHKESQMISDLMFRESIAHHDNLVLPKVGSDPQKLLHQYVMPAEKEGYEVNLHFVDLDRNKAMARLLNRFITKGRFLDPELIDKYAPDNSRNKVAGTYEALKDDPHIHGSSKWDNDVQKGCRPVLVEYRNLDGDFIDSAKARMQKGDIRSGNDRGDGRSRRSIIQERIMDRKARRGIQPAVVRGQAQDNGHPVQDGHRGGKVSGDECHTAAGIMAGAGGADGHIELTDEEIAAVPFDSGMQL